MNPVPDTLIIIPTYREAENIRNLLTIIYSLPNKIPDEGVS